MLISASRRTDIPAFHAEWLMERLRAGVVEVVNPFNARQRSRIDLTPEAVEGIVFWTRYPRPLLPHLDEMAAMGHAFYFLLTITGYSRALDVRGPAPGAAVRVFRELSDRLGPRRVRWRFDPIVFSRDLDADAHRRRFEQLAQALEGATDTVITSVLEPYAKARRRLTTAAGAPEGVLLESEAIAAAATPLLSDLAAMAAARGMTLQGCALPDSLAGAESAIPAGPCVDAALMAEIAGRSAPAPRRDTGQRPHCCCAPSRDIGSYGSCRFGCRYCYATR